MRRRDILLATPALAAVHTAAAQPGFPSRPVSLVVPFAAGGPNDLVARLVQPILQAQLGQPVVVENRPGATGAIGARHVAAQPPDGHTMLVAASGTLTVNPVVNTRIGYDPERDFAAICMAMTVPNMLVVHRDVPARTVEEVIAWLRREDGRAAYSSGGIGSTEHLGTELFLLRTGTRATHVPFPGGAPATTAMIQGTVQASILNAATVKPHVDSGALRAIAITATQRFAGLPEVPTMVEAGYPEVISASWSCFVAPANTPAPIVQRLNALLVAALRTPDVTARLTGAGFTVDALSPEETARVIAADLARWRAVVREARIEVN
ncbi:MAG TPA: tripartite tricarboxylate transporter substrate binding protein [Acetobacteraceae bacterium]|nr:tripartite tricarboxylate transporter substrate binding protein [Acetobacteraceae bacterium]